MNEYCINESWDRELDIERIKEKMEEIAQKREHCKILPKKDEDILNALKATNFNEVKVLIIGQDPYPEEKDAHGLAFSRKTGSTKGSLKNIFNELETDKDIGIKNTCGNLECWTKQGVLLLNRALTLTKTEKRGKEGRVEKAKLLKENLEIWNDIVDEIKEKLLSRKNKPLVVMLWGNPANDLFPEGEYGDNIHLSRSMHPSPLVKLNKNKETKYVFFDKCNHFSECNKFLKKHKLAEIVWETK